MNPTKKECERCGQDLGIFYAHMVHDKLCPACQNGPQKTVVRLGYHGTSTAHNIAIGDEIVAIRAEGSVNGGAWAAVNLKDAKRYAALAVNRFGGKAIVYLAQCENCREYHDNTCWSYTTWKTSGSEIRATGVAWKAR